MSNARDLAAVRPGKGAGAVATNTAVGASALEANTTGAGNTAFGLNTLIASSTGNQNTALGRSVLQANTTASSNTAVGYIAMYNNTTGANNTAMGDNALFSNTTASNNTAVGYMSVYNNSTGTNNTALGFQSLYSNTTATGNVALGYRAMYNNPPGNYNTVVGTEALWSANGAANNTAMGYQAGYGVTTGNNNTFFGYGAGQSVTTGSKNTIVGAYTGNQGGLNITTSSNYIVLSDGDGNPRGIFDGSGNWLVGTTSTSFTSSKSFIFDTTSANGYQIINHPTGSATGSAYMYFGYGTGSIGSITQNGTTAVAYNTSSDYRLKENIAPMQGALSVVSQLKPVTYTWKADGSAGQGFIAHELAEVVPDCVTGEKDAVDANGNPIYQGIDTSFLVATLTAAIQELKAEFDAYKATHP